MTPVPKSYRDGGQGRRYVDVSRAGSIFASTSQDRWVYVAPEVAGTRYRSARALG